MRRVLSWVVCGIAIAVGCGGRTTTSDSGSGGAGGVTDTGGTVVTTGTTGAGGTIGTGAGGGTSGTTTGAGGVTSGGGGSSTTGGSGGTGGAIDPGAEFSACTGAGQCELVTAKCCACGNLGLDQLAAINSSKRDAYSKLVCGPNGTPCPPCVGTIDPYLMARCESGRCRGFDIRSDPTYTKCGTDQECTLRKGLACCECNAPGDWVAVSQIGKMLISGETCGSGTVCPTCIPVPPAGTTAVCRNGACTKIP